MNCWLMRGLAGMISATTIFGAELAAASPHDAPSGYAEITAPDDRDTVAIVPRPDPHRMSGAYAIETVPDPAMHGSTAPRVIASLPAGPPLAVEIRFDPRRAENAGRANQIATELGREGVTVLATGPAAAPVSDGVGFVFTEDEAAATDIARHLAGMPGHVTQIRADARGTNAALPGTIVITLGSERGTS